MKILAIDQGLSNSGYWIDENFNGLITTDKKDEMMFRLKDIRDKFFKLSCEQNIEVVVIEGYSFGAMSNRMITAGEVGGIIRCMTAELNKPLIIIPPTLLKKYVCGKGNVKKEQMLLQCYKKFGKEFDNNNLCDAFCLNEFYSDYLLWEIIAKISETEPTEMDYTKNEI